MISESLDPGTAEAGEIAGMPSKHSDCGAEFGIPWLLRSRPRIWLVRRHCGPVLTRHETNELTHDLDLVMFIGSRRPMKAGGGDIQTLQFTHLPLDNDNDNNYACRGCGGSKETNL